MSYIEIICPYCLKHSTLQVHPGDSGERLLICDLEENGCGGMFVLILRMEYSTSFKKIEGEEQKYLNHLAEAKAWDDQCKEDLQQAIRDGQYFAPGEGP